MITDKRPSNICHIRVDRMILTESAYSARNVALSRYGHQSNTFVTFISRGNAELSERLNLGEITVSNFRGRADAVIRCVKARRQR